MKASRWDNHRRNNKFLSYFQYDCDIYRFKICSSAIKNRLVCHYAHITFVIWESATELLNVSYFLRNSRHWHARCNSKQAQRKAALFYTIKIQPNIFYNFYLHVFSFLYFTLFLHPKYGFFHLNHKEATNIINHDISDSVKINYNNQR